jgi:hypothetical protein
MGNGIALYLLPLRGIVPAVSKIHLWQFLHPGLPTE